MTTATVAKTAAHHSPLVYLKGIKYAVADRVRQVRVSREESRLEEWNMDYRAMLDKHGVSSYK